MAKAPHVIRRAGSYSFRIRVPERFRSLVNRKELWRSLRTKDGREARQRRMRVARSSQLEQPLRVEPILASMVMMLRGRMAAARATAIA